MMLKQLVMLDVEKWLLIYIYYWKSKQMRIGALWIMALAYAICLTFISIIYVYDRKRKKNIKTFKWTLYR